VDTDLQKLTDGELQEILVRTEADSQARLDAQEEVDRRALAKSRWSRSDKWAAAGVAATAAAAALAIAVTLILPQIRRVPWLDPMSHSFAKKATPPLPSAPDAPALQGIWADPDIVTNGGKVFYEFLPQGRVSVRLNNAESAPVANAGGSWSIAGGNLHMLLAAAKPDVPAKVCEGKLSGEAVEGACWPSGSGDKHAWRLQRANVTPPSSSRPQPASAPAIQAIPGIWVDPKLQLESRPIYVEFLADGHVELRDSQSGELAQPDFIYWYRVGDQIHLTWDKDGTVAQRWDLVMKGDFMEGTLTLLKNGQTSPLKLVRLGSH
jgi:hypothetical protein